MNTDQTSPATAVIAAELWDELYPFVSDRAQGIAIIKAAIEKATEAKDHEIELLRRHVDDLTVQSRESGDPATAVIAAEAGQDIYRQFKEYGHGRNLPEHWTAIIKAACEKARLEGYNAGFKDGALAANRPEYRATPSGVGQEPPFDQTKHHPSCTPSDQDLMWVCAQCGLKVDAVPPTPP